MSARTKASVSVGIVALWAAGCGGGGSTTTTVIERQAAPAATVTVAPPASESAPSSGSASGSGGASAKVPSVVGERLDVAEMDVQAAGLTFTEVGGGAFGIVVKSNWTVCSTKPAAGKKATGPIALIVDRKC